MRSNVMIGWFSRGILVVAAACIVLAPPAVMAQQHATTICSVANFLAQPGTATAPTMYAYSTLTLTNPNPGASLHIGSITVFDWNGRQVCAFAEGNPLPVKAFDPSRFFDFTEPLGPNQALNIMTARLGSCMPWPIVSTASANDILGSLTVRIAWWPERGEGAAAPLLASAVVVYADLATGRYDAARTVECSALRH